jgi:hypothetical protein
MDYLLPYETWAQFNVILGLPEMLKVHWPFQAVVGFASLKFHWWAAQTSPL